MSTDRKFLTSEELVELLERIDKLHFVGILGAGMLPLAKLARSFGYTVTGSDSKVETCEERFGFIVSYHDENNILGKDLLVISYAIGEDNPELSYARTLSLPVVSRAQLLGALMLKYQTRIGISGSHGKSTTVALIDKIFYDANLAPTTVSGATLYDGADIRAGRDEFFIYESCEYRDAFLNFSPTIQVITSIELDHTDYFNSLDDVFTSFFKSTRGANIVVINKDFADADEFIANVSTDVLTYGESLTADYRYSIIDKDADTCRFYILKRGEKIIETSTTLPGKYNLLNILAAVAVADCLGIEHDIISGSVASFFGIERRMSRIGNRAGRDIFYDYAHHPTEISLAIDAIKERYGECTVVFCPHTFSRTKDLWGGFIDALCKADVTFLLDIYPAREESIPGITSENLAKAIGDRCVYTTVDDIVRMIDRHARGAVVLMGAGDFGGLVDVILK